MTRILQIAGGTLCVALAVLGLFLPVLPTTPFPLLAAVCYARSSERFPHWLVTNRWFGAYIRNYREGRGIALWHKVLANSLLWLTIGYAVCFVAPQWWVTGILLGTAIGVTIRLLKTRTTRPMPEIPRLRSECRAPTGPARKAVLAPGKAMGC